jgi:hypothetical protein
MIWRSLAAAAPADKPWNDTGLSGLVGVSESVLDVLSRAVQFAEGARAGWKVPVLAPG